VGAEAQREVGAVELRREPLGLQCLAHRGAPRSVDVGEGVATPQPQRFVEQRLVVARGILARPGLGEQPAEAVEIDGVRIDPQHVAARLSADRDVAGTGQRLPQPGQVAGDRAVRAVRRPVGPDAFGELIRGDRPVGVGEEGSEHTSLPGVAQVDGLAVDEGLDGAEQSEADCHFAPRVAFVHPGYRPPLCCGYFYRHLAFNNRSTAAQPCSCIVVLAHHRANE
jgi:hypothetical protein